MQIIRVGVDLAKNVFQLHGVDRSEKTVWRRKLVRGDWIRALLDRIEPGCKIGMEACNGAHHWARVLQAQGFTVKLIAPQFVKPYVKSNKNDANDAEAICEAMSRPSMRSVAVKTVKQQDNGKALRNVCRQFVVLCQQLDLFSDAVVAIDGSKFKAVNSSDRNFTQAKLKRRMEEIEANIGRYLAELDTADR